MTICLSSEGGSPEIFPMPTTPVVRDAEDKVAVSAECFQVYVREGRNVLNKLSLLLLGRVGEYLLEVAVGRLVVFLRYQPADLFSMPADVQIPTYSDWVAARLMHNAACL